MSALGFGWLKRRALRNFPSVTDISISDSSCNGDAEVQMTWKTSRGEDEEDDPFLEMLMTTHFPYNNVKSGVIPLHGRSFEYKVVHFTERANVACRLLVWYISCHRTPTPAPGSPLLISLRGGCFRDGCPMTGELCTTLEWSSTVDKMIHE